MFTNFNALRITNFPIKFPSLINISLFFPGSREGLRVHLRGKNNLQLEAGPGENASLYKVLSLHYLIVCSAFEVFCAGRTGKGWPLKLPPSPGFAHLCFVSPPGFLLVQEPFRSNYLWQVNGFKFLKVHWKALFKLHITEPEISLLGP